MKYNEMCKGETHMCSILIVEDEDVIRQGLKKMITDMHLDEVEGIFEASDGRSALRFWQSIRPQIVLTDIKMSNMDGIEFIESVRRMDNRTRFVIISGYGEFAYAQKAIINDVSEYLLKPVNREKLKEILKGLIARLGQNKVAYTVPLNTDGNDTCANNMAINSVISYIYHNYQHNICLNMAANYVSMNPNYFSMLFKKSTGLNFVKYLQKVRIEKSKELLVQPDIRIHDIASLVGFNNDKYFFKVFKEFEGTTPSEFKRMYEADKGSNK